MPLTSESVETILAPDEPPAIADALVSAGQALVSVGGADGRAVVDQALAYPMTNALAKERLVAVVRAADAAAPPGPSGAAPPKPGSAQKTKK